MSEKSCLILIIILAILFYLSSCVLFKPKKEPKEELLEGMKGQIIPVDRAGEEILYQERENIIINLMLLKEGSPIEDQTITFNPELDGSFFIVLKTGEYAVEIFLKGFYVESFNITVEEAQVLDRGIIEIREIEAGTGVPIKGEKTDEVILNEGDVNIQPPS